MKPPSWFDSPVGYKKKKERNEAGASEEKIT